MNYYYKTPVYDDMVSYRETETAGTDYPLREYFNATPLGVTYDQFSEFITLIGLFKANPPTQTGDKGANTRQGSNDFFVLTPEQEVEFANIINYYDGKYADWFKLSDDATSQAVNSATQRAVRWNTPRTVQNDRYGEQRTYTAPYVIEQNQQPAICSPKSLEVSDLDYTSVYSLDGITNCDPIPETIPTKYRKERYWSGHTSSLGGGDGMLNDGMVPEQGVLPDYDNPIMDENNWLNFNLIPTAEDTPFWDYRPTSGQLTQKSHRFEDFTYVNLR